MGEMADASMEYGPDDFYYTRERSFKPWFRSRPEDDFKVERKGGSMKAILDMETRSEVNLKDCGVYVYAAHESTDVMCIAIKLRDGQPVIWINPKFDYMLHADHATLPTISSDELQEWVDIPSELHAHNAQFERIMWQEVMVKKYGFKPIDFMKWRCTAAKAASFALPRDLARACKDMDCRAQKDMAGHRIMMRMCKPDSKGHWYEDPEAYYKLCLYCIQDTEAEDELDLSLHDLSKDELEVYRLDQRINDFGIQVDLEGVENLIYKIRYKQKKLLAELQDITDGVIETGGQRDKILAWLKTYWGVELDDLTKKTVEAALADENVIGSSRRLLEIRQSLAKTSVSKLDAMQRTACADGRMRGTMLYHGASTGRWAGKHVQPHNFVRLSFDEAELEDLLTLGVQEAEELHGMCIIAQASKCLRGMLIAAPGHRLRAADYSAIEGRGLAWIAGEEFMLDNYRNGLDAYKVTATNLFGVDYDDVNPKQRQAGKVCELACGYQGWVAAFRVMADDEVNKMTDEEIEVLVKAWRSSRPATTQFWKGVETAAVQAVTQNSVFNFGRVTFGMRGRFLHCRLPSGRVLSYIDPQMKHVVTKYDQEKEVISFMGINSYTNKWERLTTYGGKLTENIVQALCRDILAEAMVRLDKAGYHIPLHVHDEVVVEEPWSQVGDMEGFLRLVTQVPHWATGFPITADGWVGQRYRKG